MADDPKKKLTPEEIYLRLKPLHDAMMESAELNQRVYDAVEKELGRITREFYPGMKDYWQAEQFRKLADKISIHACQFCIELSDIDYAAEKSLEPTAEGA